MQMGARWNRSTSHGLELLVSQIHAAWAGQGQDKGIASILSLDMSGAFNHVVLQRLVHILKSKGLPESLVGWISSFMQQRTATLWFENQESQKFNIEAGIPQGSPLSPILFLFYNSGLVEACNSLYYCAFGLGFVDDVNILAYGKSTQETTQTLQKLHEKCQNWATKHGATFAPEKYSLMHFSHCTRRFDMHN